MPVLFQNIIQKQVLEVIANTSDNGFALQQATERICKDQLLPALDKLLEKYNLSNEVIQLDQLFIEVNDLTTANFESVFLEKVIYQIEQAISQKIAEKPQLSSASTASVAQSTIELLVFYLQKGYLPWWSPVKTSTEWKGLLNQMFSSEEKVTNWEVLISALKSPVVRERLVAEINEEQFWYFIKTGYPVYIETLQIDLTLISRNIMQQNHLHAFIKGYKMAILTAISQKSNSVNAIENVIAANLTELVTANFFHLKAEIPLAEIKNESLRELIVVMLGAKGNQGSRNERLEQTSASDEQLAQDVSTDIEFPISAKPDEIRASELTPKADIYIVNSGLVIIAPYLGMLFKNIGIVEKDTITDIPKALSLIHYLASGTDAFAEFEAVLPKVLCGLSLQAVVQQKKLTELEKDQANELLKAVIDHWAILKNTSVEGLQVSFLQREGKLVFKQDEWRLKVHSMAYDVLLSQLPWNINMIKLPWMKNLLRVEWV